MWDRAAESHVKAIIRTEPETRRQLAALDEFRSTLSPEAAAELAAIQRGEAVTTPAAGKFRQGIVRALAQRLGWE